MNWFYQCSECQRTYDITPERMLCADCSQKQEAERPLRGVLDVRNAEKSVSADWTIADLLPVEASFFPAMPVGNTPLWEPRNLRQKLRFPHLFLKDDTANPTGSLKDRASFLVAAFALRHGLKQVVLASTGNAASSMAGIGAAAGLEVVVFLPRTAPRAKLVQSLIYGATIYQVDGTYDRAYDLSLEYAKAHHVLSRNTGYNPLTIEGKKTVALEIVQQLGRMPDYVFVPVGDGVILSGVFKGFRDLIELGLFQDMPSIVAVQSDSSNALYRAYLTGDFSSPVPASTVADSIRVDVPRNGYHALKQLRTFQGTCISVSDDEILHAQQELARTCGLFAEPAGATALAGLMANRDKIPRSSIICLLITGNGLKDPETAMNNLSIPVKTIKRLEDLR